MSLKIIDDCIGCGACEPQCANQAISEGETQYVIDPYKCTECIGNFPYPRCEDVCPVHAHVPDPDHQDAQKALLSRWEWLHGPMARPLIGPGFTKAFTEAKPIDEIKESLDGMDRVFIIGCGRCASWFNTGGHKQVVEMKKKLEGMGKTVTGWVVGHTPCENMTEEAPSEEDIESINQAQSVLVMACALAVQTVASWVDKPVRPALNTLVIGREERPGYFSETCVQCGECMLAWTGGICPISQCAKNLVNGPCGGTKDGKCEVNPDRDCVWTLIYQRLDGQGRAALMSRYRPFRDFQKVITNGEFIIEGSRK